MSSNEHFVTTTTTANSALEKHVKFWDRKNKGYITPVDTVFGFINLGYGLVISVTLGTFLGILFSYSTQDSWIPDVLCRTRTAKLQKDLKGEPYDSVGQLDLELFENLFSKHAKSDISGKTITIKELLEWNESTYKDPLTWSATALEWMAIYILVGSKGVVKKEDIQAAYDGTLFYQVRDRNRRHRTIIQGTTADNNNNNLNVSGVKVSKSYVRQLESQVSNAINVLPRNTVSLLDTRLRHWLSFVQQNKQQPEIQTQSILKGVPTPVPTRRPLFSSTGDEMDDATDTSYEPSPLINGGLTGVMGINILDHAVPLTGVQNFDNTIGNNDNGEVVGLSGMKAYSAKDDGDIGDNIVHDEYGSGVDNLASSMTGIRSEKDDDYHGNPHINWLHIGQLTGVSPSTSATTNFSGQQQNSNMDDIGAHDDFDTQPMVFHGDEGRNVSTPPLTENSSVTSDMDGIVEDGSDTSKDHEELNNKTTLNTNSNKKKNKKNKKKKNKQQQQQQQPPTPPAKDDSIIQEQEKKSPSVAPSTPPFTVTLRTKTNKIRLPMTPL
ncbi:Caleosin related protein-domain-containing protein [Absidia repens]|uniref:Caleosin related protein-domain-containing protein n=1 Tax=Absidia repens TaxID=90262 RepID=A0A1X2I092_9FUNG|nr:Caleosin related protein-domain-containing protein [Absidia repens]